MQLPAFPDAVQQGRVGEPPVAAVFQLLGLPRQVIQDVQRQLQLLVDAVVIVHLNVIEPSLGFRRVQRHRQVTRPLRLRQTSRFEFQLHGPKYFASLDQAIPTPLTLGRVQDRKLRERECVCVCVCVCVILWVGTKCLICGSCLGRLDFNQLPLSCLRELRICYSCLRRFRVASGGSRVLYDGYT